MKNTQKISLSDMLTDARLSAFFGRTWAIKAAILNKLLTAAPQPFAEIARAHGVGRQHVGRLFKKAKMVFPEISRLGR